MNNHELNQLNTKQKGELSPPTLMNGTQITGSLLFLSNKLPGQAFTKPH